MSARAIPLLAQAQKALAARQVQAALILFQQAESHGEDRNACSGGKWESYMLAGDFESAWKESDILCWLDAPDIHRLWNGEPITGKRVMVRCLHGFGDAIQFLRYASRLRAQVKELHVQVAPTFTTLANEIDDVAPVTSWDTAGDASSPSWDVQVEVMQLPYLFRSLSCSLPQPPYLRLSTKEVRLMQDEMVLREAGCGLPRVGLCWHCGEWNNSRAIPAALFQPIIRHIRAQFYNLNNAKEEDVWDGLFKSSTCYDANDLGAGLLRLATVISNLDLVITVDTMVAHIAGAMCKPVWLMLQHSADWRWMIGRRDSPWYPSMRIFRQSKPGNWKAVLHEVEKELALCIASKGDYAAMG